VTEPVEQFVRLVARFGLPPGVGGPAAGARDHVACDPPVEPLGTPHWRTFLATVAHARLEGLLQAAIDASELPVTDEQRQEAGECHADRCASLLGLERVLLDVVDRLERAGIDTVVLKGAAYAHLVYPDPSWRVFRDNDLLLPGEAFHDAIRELRAAGYERRLPEPRPGFDARFGKGATLEGPGGDELDLHRTLVFGSFGLRIDLDELFASAVTFQLGGRRLKALGPETRFLHVCYHAALGDPVPRLLGVRDVAQVLHLEAHDTDRVLDLIRAWQAPSVVARGMELCRTVLEIEAGGPIASAVAAHVPTRREIRAIESYVGDRRGFATKVLASLPYLDGVGEKLTFLRAAALPDQELRRSVSGGGSMAWFRRGARTLAHRRRGGGSSPPRTLSERRDGRL
jgi:hypothetical protein